MSHTQAALDRRRFLKTAARASAILAIPQFIPGAASGKDGVVLPGR